MNTQWRIELFGGLRLLKEGAVTEPFKPSKPLELLAYLAYHQGVHARKEIAGDLWAEKDDPLGNLRAALKLLRSQLKTWGVYDGEFIRDDRHNATLQLNPDVTTDAAEFDAAFDAAERASDAAKKVRHLATAVELFLSGKLLYGYAGDWIDAARGELSASFLSALHKLIRLLAQSREHDRALHYAQRAVSLHPLCETSCRLIMRLYDAMNHPADALRQYRELEQALGEKMNIQPSARTQKLFREISDKWARNSQTSSSTGNLPLPLTRFFGRADEIAQLRHLIRNSDARLITLTGAGGSGKTRLAIEVAQRLKEELNGAVWFAPLADLSDPRFIADALRDALCLPRSPTVEPLEQVIGALSKQPSLLVLDSLEHLLSADFDSGLNRFVCGDDHPNPLSPLPKSADSLIHTLLSRVPSLKCLVTSRQPLSLTGVVHVLSGHHATGKRDAGNLACRQDCPRHIFRGEREFSVTPLPLPDSVPLFEDRARAVKRDFRATPEVTALCERLEGIPLAIELAAARIHTHTPEAMLKELKDRFNFLITHRHDVPEHHRTLRAAIEWSYRRLSPEHQRFLACLSIFRSGWTADAAAQVTGFGLWVVGSGEQPQNPQPKTQNLSCKVLDALSLLRSHSLISPDDGATPMRFRMLDTLREFAALQLKPKEREWLAWRHVNYFLRWAEETPRQPDTLRQLAAAQADLRAAFDFLLQCGEVEEGARLASALADVWIRRAAEREGRAWMERVLRQKDALSHWRRCEVLTGAGRFALGMGDLTAAQSFCEEALTIARQEQPPNKVAEISGFLGTLAHAQGDYKAAARYCDDVLAHWHQDSNKLGIAWALAQKADSFYAQGDLTQARAVYEEVLALQRELGTTLSVAHMLYRLSDLHATTGDGITARALLEESLTIRRQQEDPVGVAECLRELGLLAKDSGDFAKARTLLEESLNIVRPLDKPEFVASLRSCLGGVACCEGNLREARTTIEECLAFWRGREHPRWTAGMLRQLAAIALHENKSAQARALLEESLALYHQVGDPLGGAEAQTMLGRVTSRLGDYERAESLLREALTTQNQANLLPAITRSLEGFAHLAAAQGDAVGATTLLGASEAQREILTYPLPPVERPAQDDLIAHLQSNLGAAAFNAAHAAGYRMRRAEAVAYALEKRKRK
jgi:predicted ATPase